MKQLTFALALLLLCISYPTSVAAAKVEVEGKAWLDSQKDPAEINMNGTWNSEEWGDLHLIQPEEPGRERQRRWIQDRRRSQRQTLIPAICRKPHRGILRNTES